MSPNVICHHSKTGEKFLKQKNMNTNMPTIAIVLPMKTKRWNGFSVTNTSQNEAKLTYIKLNRQTPCPLRRAVPVNQGCAGGSFTRNTRIAFGHGGDRSSYVSPLNVAIPFASQF
jgi:hypothetical protein